MSGKIILLGGAAVLLALGTAQAQTTVTAHKHKRHHKTVVIVKTVAPAAASGGMAQGAPAASASPAPQASGANPDLEERVRRLEEQLDVQQEKEQAEHTRLTSLEQSFGDTQWSFDNARPTVKSGDGRFSMAIRVRFQFDDINYFQDQDVHTITPTRNVQFKDLSSGALVRRAFFGVEGKAFNDFWYELRYNGGGGGSAETDPKLSLARVAYLGLPNFELNIGVIEPAFMYEGTMSSGALPFLERPEIDNIAADSFGAGDSRRGIEARYQKQGLFMPDDNLVLDAAFTGAKTESTTGHGNGGDEQSQILAHGAYRLWSDGISNISLSGDYSHAFTGGCAGCAPGAVNPINLQDRPEFREDGDRLISTGSINAKTANMWAVSGGANFENFYAGGEYARFTVDRLPILSGGAVAFAGDTPEFSGWYVEGSWVITGEPKTYTVSATNNEVGGFGAPKVVSPFSWSGNSWGAWELTARYSETDLNWNQDRIPDPLTLTQAGIAGGEERIIMLGLNWYLNNNVKLQLNDGITHVSKIAAPGSNVQVGQDMNILGVRLQFTN
jgi:phosphate-selective porin OprO and OprP